LSPPAIDLHCHLFPQAYLDLARAEGARLSASIYRRSDGREFLRGPGDFDYPLGEELWSVPALVGALDRRGVSMAAVSVAPPTLSYWADPGLAAELSAAMNDNLAEAVRAQPGRLVGLCTVPLQDIPRAVAELERAMRRPEFRGAMIGSNVAGRNLDDPSYAPFWEAAAALGACLFVHPYQVVGSERMQRYYLHNFIGMVTETCLAIESLLLGGVYERFPGLRTYFAHGGGSFPWLRGRAEHGFHAITHTSFGTRRPPSAYLPSIYVDSMTYLPSALSWLVGELGADHVVLGSDYPFDIGPAEPLAIIADAPGLTAAQRADIRWNTAARLLGLEASAPAPPH